MPRIFKHLEAGCLQVNLMSTSVQINQLKYTILLYLLINQTLYLCSLFTNSLCVECENFVNTKVINNEVLFNSIKFKMRLLSTFSQQFTTLLTITK